MNVKRLPKENRALQTLKNVTFGNVAFGNVVEDDVEDVLSVDAYISKLHLTNLEKQHATLKPYKLQFANMGFF
jgi:hypothetical protein